MQVLTAVMYSSIIGTVVIRQGNQTFPYPYDHAVLSPFMIDGKTDEQVYNSIISGIKDWLQTYLGWQDKYEITLSADNKTGSITVGSTGQTYQFKLSIKITD